MLNCSVGRHYIVKRFVTISFLLVCLTAVVLLLWPHEPAGSKARRTGTLFFLGFTNLPVAGRHAVFCLTNGTESEFACHPEAVQEWTGTGWTTNRVPPWPSGWIGLGDPLRPSQSRTFYIPAPKSSTPWRLQFVCQESAGLANRTRDFVSSVKESVASGSLSVMRTFGGRRYEILSPEVSE